MLENVGFGEYLGGGGGAGRPTLHAPLTVQFGSITLLDLHLQQNTMNDA